MAISPAGPGPLRGPAPTEAGAGGIFHPRVRWGRGPAFGRGGDGGNISLAGHISASPLASHHLPSPPLQSPLRRPASRLPSPPRLQLRAAATHRARRQRIGRQGAVGRRDRQGHAARLRRPARHARAWRGDGRSRRGCSAQAWRRPAIHVSNTPKYSRRFTCEVLLHLQYSKSPTVPCE
ncbi:unknown protein [Oryza sativa Japonica Group]|uniref:Os01g0880100 protein n=2 Tax=Oryza sativa subsp. japonica TaxID=39947 RepID=B7F145_ORYSJ|nr:uncharacterized protein LOC9267054 [Oryza sativa Japonica Group]BAD81671.1 unknown protein [Oryza sativa Japonica Group]BAG98342.1 unnamed protein product [Oryza sativa Japonica Group]BAH91405.1 Os01g0880100 [Oryza sativa Japonica Group]|eukprot:NP_001172675.1 Os01g0880100 [Oryza sativa Japonica Group]